MRNTLLAILVFAGFITLAGAGASRYVNGTEIPQAVTLLYSTGAQPATLGATAVSGSLSVADNFSLTDIAATVTADVGSAQGNGVITNTVVRVSTSAVSGDAQTLPSAVAGLVHVVCNHAAANPVDVFPASGDQINIVSLNGAIALAAGECMICFAANVTNWGCVIGSAT